MTEQNKPHCGPTATNVRLVTEKDRGVSAGLFAVDIMLADGRKFPAALTASLSAKSLHIAGGSDAWCNLCPPEVPFEALEAAEQAALEAVRKAAVAWPLARTVRTLSHVEQPNEDGNFPVQWELTCPHCGTKDWDNVDERGSWGILRCENGHLSKVAIVEHNGEKLFTTVEAK